MVVSFEKRLMIHPKGLEVKKAIGALETRSSIELCRRLLRLRRAKVTTTVVSPLSITDPIESKTNLNFIREVICYEADSLSHSEMMKRT